MAIGAYILSLLSVLVAGVAVFVSYYSISKQIKMQEKMKLIDLQREWMHQLRESMAEFQSIGMTPGLNHQQEREFYEHGTKIELLMNKDDEYFNELQCKMYKLLDATSTQDKYEANSGYITVCQKIIEREWSVLTKGLHNNSK